MEEDDIWHLLTDEEKKHVINLKRQAAQRHLVTALGDFALYCRAQRASQCTASSPGPCERRQISTPINFHKISLLGETSACLGHSSSSTAKPEGRNSVLQLPPNVSLEELRSSLAITDKAKIDLLISMASMKKKKKLRFSARFFVDATDFEAGVARSRGEEKTAWGDDLAWPFEGISAFHRLEDGLRIQQRPSGPCIVLTLHALRVLEELVQECSFGLYGQKDWATRLYGPYWPLAVHYLVALQDQLMTALAATEDAQLPHVPLFLTPRCMVSGALESGENSLPPPKTSREKSGRKTKATSLSRALNGTKNGLQPSAVNDPTLTISTLRRLPRVDVPLTAILQSFVQGSADFSVYKMALDALASRKPFIDAEHVIDTLFTEPLVSNGQEDADGEGQAVRIKQLRESLRRLVEVAESDKMAASLLEDEEIEISAAKSAFAKKEKRKRRKKESQEKKAKTRLEQEKAEKEKEAAATVEVKEEIEDDEIEVTKKEDMSDTMVAESEVQEYFDTEELRNEFGLATPILEDSELGTSKGGNLPLLPWSYRLNNRVINTYHEDSRLEFMLRNGPKAAMGTGYAGSDMSSDERFPLRSGAGASLDEKMLTNWCKYPSQKKYDSPRSHPASASHSVCSDFRMDPLFALETLGNNELMYENESFDPFSHSDSYVNETADGECVLDFDALLAELEKWKQKAHSLQRELDIRNVLAVGRQVSVGGPDEDFDEQHSTRSIEAFCQQSTLSGFGPPTSGSLDGWESVSITGVPATPAWYMGAPGESSATNSAAPGRVYGHQTSGGNNMSSLNLDGVLLDMGTNDVGTETCGMGMMNGQVLNSSAGTSTSSWQQINSWRVLVSLLLTRHRKDFLRSLHGSLPSSQANNLTNKSLSIPVSSSSPDSPNSPDSAPVKPILRYRSLSRGDINTSLPSGANSNKQSSSQSCRAVSTRSYDMPINFGFGLDSSLGQGKKVHFSFDPMGTHFAKSPSVDASTQTAPAITLSKIYGSSVPSVLQREIERLRRENQMLRYRASQAMSNFNRTGRPRDQATQTQPAITLSKMWASLGVENVILRQGGVQKNVWGRGIRRQSDEMVKLPQTLPDLPEEELQSEDENNNEESNHGTGKSEGTEKNEEAGDAKEKNSVNSEATTKGEAEVEYLNDNAKKHYGMSSNADILRVGQAGSPYSSTFSMPISGRDTRLLRQIQRSESAPQEMANNKISASSQTGPGGSNRAHRSSVNINTNTIFIAPHATRDASLGSPTTTMRPRTSSCNATMVSCPPSPLSSGELASSPAASSSYGDLMRTSGLPIPPVDMMKLGQDIANLERRMGEETLATKEARDEIFKRMCRVVRNTWPRAKVELYGSSAVGLALPSSDMDLVITDESHQRRREMCAVDHDGAWSEMSPAESYGHIGASGTWWQSVLYQRLAAEAWEMHPSGWVLSDTIKQIENTAVPILSFIAIHKATTQVHVDVSFDAPNHKGISGLEAFSYFLEIPLLRPLVLTLKLFLQKHNLSTSYSGGLSSYGLANMVACYLLQSKDDVIESALLGFLSFYGRQFDPRVHGVSVLRAQFVLRDGTGWIHPLPEFLAKGWGHLRCSPTSEAHKFDPMFIEDPLDPTNNVARNCFRFRQIQKVFDKALESLMQENDILSIIYGTQRDDGI